MKYLILGLALFCEICAFSQNTTDVSLRVQNNYFISGQPVFGFGIDLSKRKATSINFMLEYGKYASNQKDFSSANVETYSLRGFALGSEFRIYQPFSPAPSNKGLFIGGFTSVKRLVESITSGVQVVSGGLDLSDIGSSQAIAYTNNTGVTTGWRLGDPDKKLMLEGSLGLGYQTVYWAEKSSSHQVEPQKLSNALVSRIEMAFLIRL